MAQESTRTQISSRADRPLSYEVEDFTVPQGNEEEWRFTPIERIEDFFAPSVSGTAPSVQFTGEASYEQVDRTDARLGKVQAPEDRTGALAWNAFELAHVVTLEADRQYAGESVLTVSGENCDQVSGAHLLINAERFSEGTVVINHVGSARLTEGVEVSVGAGAHLTLVSIQDWDDDAAHALSNRIRIDRDGTLRHIVVTLGGDIVRVTTAVEYAAPGGSVDLLGAYFVDEKQHLEHRLFVDHNQPNCRSNVTYKGALQGDGAHSVWVGDVLIRPEAEGTDTYELNRNLVLTDGARADSVPNLEIETGEIEGAGHASATGRFDDEQLFYLKSRGIPEDEARRLVVRGFFAELINKIGVESVQNKLMNAIEDELSLTMGREND
ncbi:Fe-S cluster assembly protein SufD [Arcanobacterium pluranimalium]|uniref:Fe-S cluster assembly protein SufD n=1 Tax=Arcanobacterium pluranimalium TaxID=108028 RepID=UPI001956F15D|nr:Fe-S cluster assembly protein SufD [Arcanobacterium pluranimalium]MBM7825335.1 Fe-S cluster assembly protein SufD [Arcanobacterium pluranimalium]